ncbi:serine hydrolase domain-containing protein [Streptomyces sp. NPDC005876]|uniref:serine hydrolase domain-containing protein n=1 Tax=unclassified Streptomyces TaxID=2593676 RepID=UPI0033DBA62F
MSGPAGPDRAIGRTAEGGPGAPSDAALERHVTRGLLSAMPDASAVAVALHRRGRRALVVRGRTAHRGGVPATADTRFEVGSLTKTFTALLLAEQAARGELGLDDPLARHLPAGTAVPHRGTPITLTHIATHTSGLPGVPPAFPRLLPALSAVLLQAPWCALSGAYAAYRSEQALRALGHIRLAARPGSRVRYSNYAVGLLGQALPTAAAGLPYPDLLRTRVLHPLGLRDTTTAAHPPPGTSQAIGYWRRRPQPPLRMPAFTASGELRSSARDLLTLTEALITPDSLPGLPHALRAALREVQRPRLRLPRRRGMLALIWNIRPRPDGSHLYFHTGGTFGFTAFAGFSPEHRTALVVLANTSAGRRNDIVQQAYTTLTGLHR